MSLGVVVLGDNWQRGSCPTGVMVLGGNCPRGSCPQGSCPRGSCPRGSCPRTLLITALKVQRSGRRERDAFPSPFQVEFG